MGKKIFAKGRCNQYYANGYIDELGVTVLAGSTVNPTTGRKLNLEADIARSDRKIVSEDSVVLKDVSFKSLSTAACFVTGYICNGHRVWRTKDGTNPI